MLIGIQRQSEGKYRVLQGSEVVACLTIPADPREATAETIGGHTLSWAAVGFIGIFLDDLSPAKPRNGQLGDSLAGFLKTKEGRWGAGLTAAKMKDCVWLKPLLVGDFEYTEWTGDGHLRRSSFVGLRTDKKAKDVVREASARMCFIPACCRIGPVPRSSSGSLVLVTVNAPLRWRSDHRNRF